MSDEYISRSPRDQRFYRLLAMAMTISRLGHQKWWRMGPTDNSHRLVQMHRNVVIITAPCVLVSQIVYLYVNFSILTLDMIGMIFSIVPITVFVNVLIIAAQMKNFEKVMKQFMDKIHLYNFRDESDFACKILITVERRTRWTTYTIFTLFMSVWIGWIVTSLVYNHVNAELIRNRAAKLQTILYLYMPFDYEYNHTHWFFMHLFNAYLVWLACVIVVTSQTIMYAFVYNLLGHIGILRHKIRTNLNGANSDVEVNKKLIDIVKYHNFVLRIFKDMKKAFGLSIASNYLYNLVGDSLLLFQLMFGSPENRMVYGLMAVVYVGGLIVMSFALEEIRRQTVDLSDLVYNLPWEKMSVRNQKTVLLFLVMTQAPLVFIASGGMITGVKPMISILKSTFSYYVMLKSSMKD